MIRKLYRAPDPELDAQLDLILKHEHDDRYPLLATTLGGYGITDAYTKVEADGKFGLLANAVIETGSNANGTWRKWADGTLECWAIVTAPYYNESSLALAWTYPAEFAAAPIVHVDLTGNAKIGGIADPWYLSRWIIINLDLHYAIISVLKGHNINTMTSYNMQNGDYQDLMVSVKGRWN